LNPVLHQLFLKFEEDGTLPNSCCDAPDAKIKDTIRKLKTQIPYEH